MHVGWCASARDVNRSNHPKMQVYDAYVEYLNKDFVFDVRLTRQRGILRMFPNLDGVYIDVYYEKDTNECIWCDIKTVNTKYYVASLYHPPNPMYHEREKTNHLEQILSLESNARIIVARNVNQLKI